MTSLSTVIQHNNVLLCCGTGGVGKTTVSAALGVAAAQQGRRAVVVTIDPARRLADALGLDGIDNSCVQVGGDWPGEMWVTMLDTKATFDLLIERHAADEAQAKRILANRYYRNLSTGLSGTREFMAMERLYELHHDERFDLVIVDTPPSRNALDFLDAPDKLARFLDGRLFKLATPGRRLTQKMTAPLIVLLRRVARVVSPEVVDDTLAFIEAFGGMEDGFRQRAKAVDVLMGNTATSFVLVAAATQDAVQETTFFAERLAEAELTIGALVLNRLQPRFSEMPSSELKKAGGGRADVALLADLTALREQEEATVSPLVSLVGDAPVVGIDQFNSDVHDLASIGAIADYLR